jgi:membrane protein
MVKAINRAYELRETRPWWKLWGISLLMILGFVLVVATLAFVVFGPEVGGYVQSLTGLPDAFLALWGTLRWALAFLAVTLAHDLLYYLAPNARIPFKWITPGGFTATVLILLSSAALNLYVVNFARYNQIYGQVRGLWCLSGRRSTPCWYAWRRSVRTPNSSKRKAPQTRRTVDFYEP